MISTQLMQQAGVRRLAVISGDPAWCLGRAAAWRDALPGDWLELSPAPLFFASSEESHLHKTPGAVRTLLGREFHHAIFDARQGFHAEAFAALAGTLTAGSWLLLLVPPWQAWSQQPDSDSLRWADVAEPIATPHFVHHLQQLILADDQVLLDRQHQPCRFPAQPDWPQWHCQAPQQQQAILEQLMALPSGVAVLTAARGRGKSALAGMLARQNRHCLVTAPAKASTEVLAAFAADHFHFMAPDALLALETPLQVEWLIVDEAAAIPAPLLQELVSRYPRVLLTTTVQGYEGSGRGFILKFCAGLTGVHYFTLDEPLRWSRFDPLEQWLNQALLFEDASATVPDSPLTPHRVERHDFSALDAAYRLLTSAHYRTSPLDLRRLLDAPGMQLWRAGDAPALQGALWLVEEGGLEPELAQAVWAGTRRPRGNLVAQSLAAHAGLVEAATLRSQRISRIAVAAESRRRGTGQQLVAAAANAAADHDYLSVSFGYTESLWAFWRACGFTLVRIGSQREASSGCYAAMALLPCSAAGDALTRRAAEQLARDWPRLRQHIALELQFDKTTDDELTAQDSYLAVGFAWSQRPLESSLPVLQRLVESSAVSVPLLASAVAAPDALSDLARQAGLSGRKALIAKLRQQAASALESLGVTADALHRPLK
ncbi:MULTISPECIES: tRNA(Met) cytidine acetyltransferase TmcA [Pantoea]|uniref:tRNA(Met) cytidine acetyltransferase TmcA n=2 Tax=Pantoea TaxID=53335 RepID=A0AB34CR53_9GAMM|nr:MULTISPECIES: GNAT family N-acetyltransferase [Pantoea]KAA5923939.1 tRNA(Met) cytidine acetyltransferase [Pantoea sp. VH_8]KAA5930185.1 tRNA(Met) cytidine acetyltransferase [Pantoea sp. VH_4]KAA5982337.1 tRNA(Met) cytidine acetyltransferase [Pantoea sp. M_4]KAA6129160.1 tRNA(Met) cytidine acetyltransferase [Pantoea gossypiicola]